MSALKVWFVDCCNPSLAAAVGITSIGYIFGWHFHLYGIHLLAWVLLDENIDRILTQISRSFRTTSCWPRSKRAGRWRTSMGTTSTWRSSTTASSAPSLSCWAKSTGWRPSRSGSQSSGSPNFKMGTWLVKTRTSEILFNLVAPSPSLFELWVLSSAFTVRYMRTYFCHSRNLFLTPRCLTRVLEMVCARVCIERCHCILCIMKSTTNAYCVFLFPQFFKKSCI